MTDIDEKAHLRLPAWIKDTRMSIGSGHEVRRVLRDNALHTVCEQARCPNIGSCFERGTATFLILGNRCTRACRFCNVDSGKPAAIDTGEAQRVAMAAQRLKLKHVVVTSVTRDDLEDGGAAQFAQVIRALQALSPTPRVEVLVPDFAGHLASVDVVLAAKPDIFNHNVETVPRLYAEVRPGAQLERSLSVLQRAKGCIVKSGFMVGLGETDDEVFELLATLAAHSVQVVTIGQYLRPKLSSLPVQRYVEPQRFEDYRRAGLELGFREVVAGPLVRSSYLADQVLSQVCCA